MATLIQLRRDTSANWASNNPVLSSGEIGVATDLQQFKIGNSASSWNQLEYVNAIPSDYIPLSASNSFDLFGSASAAEINAKAYADTVVSNIIDSAPGALDTLNEIAAAINDDPDFFNTVATNLSTHESDTTNVHGIADTSLLATTSYVDTAESDAIASANAYSDGLAVNYDAAGSASAAEINAKSYADSLAVNYDSIGSASAAEFNAKSYADSLATNYDSAGSASAAQTAAQSYADSLSSNYDSAGSASAALNSAKSYTDSEVANLVDSAPTTLDTLNELAAALGDDPNFATSTASAIGERLTIANASATYLTINDASSTYIPLTASSNFDPAGSAATAQSAAESYADSLAVNYDSVGSASAAEFNAKAYADSLATNYDAIGSASAAEFNSNSYTDTEISNLIASAPAGLDTLNELAAAINDDPTFYLSVSASLDQYLSLASASATYFTKEESLGTFVQIEFGTTAINSNSTIDGGAP